MNVLYGFSFFAGAILEVLILHSLLKGGYKKFPLLFIDVLVLLFTGIIDATLYFDIGLWVGAGPRIYWIDDAIRQTFLFLLVLSLVYQSMASGPKRAQVQRLLVLGLLVFAAISYYGFPHAKFNVWMTAVLRNMSFCAAVLNLGLWAVLIQRRQRDPQMLLLSGGLGLQMTGEAMGHSLRNLWEISRVYVVIGNVVLMLAYLLCLLTWWQAFRNTPRKSGVPSLKTPKPRFDQGKAKRYTSVFQDVAFIIRGGQFSGR